MITLESLEFALSHLPEQLCNRIDELGMIVTVGGSPSAADTFRLEAYCAKIDADVGIDLDSDMLPAEIAGWILPQFCVAIEIFTAEKRPAHAQMHLRA